jgi:hypothetical protein
MTTSALCRDFGASFDASPEEMAHLRARFGALSFLPGEGAHRARRRNRLRGNATSGVTRPSRPKRPTALLQNRALGRLTALRVTMATRLVFCGYYADGEP